MSRPSSVNLINHFTCGETLTMKTAVDYGFLYSSNIDTLWRRVVEAGVSVETLNHHMIHNTLDTVLRAHFSAYELHTFLTGGLLLSPYSTTWYVMPGGSFDVRGAI